MRFVLLMCSERGGSNLLTQLLAAHPRVCGPTPCHVARILLDHADRYGELREPAAWDAAVNDAHAVFAAKLGTWAIDGCSPADLARWAPSRTLLGLAEGLFRAEAAACGAELVVMKVNRSWRHLDAFLDHFADLRIIGQVRDPRDMALSWARSPVLRGELPRAARIWRDDQAGLRRSLERLAGTGRARWHRYEALVAAPDERIGLLWDWLGLPPHTPDWQDGAVARAAGGSTMWANLSKPVMSNNTEKWRTALSPVEQRYVEDVVGELLSWAGYRASGAAPLTPDQRAGLERAERFEKAEYQSVPEAERRRHAAWAETVQRISDRPPAGARCG